MPGWMAISLLVLMRVTALMIVVPGVTHGVVPWRARLLLIALLVIPVLCVLPAPAEDVPLGDFFACLAHEFVVGISLGLVPAAIVWGLQIAVQALHGMTGLPGGAEMDSTGMEAPMQRLFLFAVLTIFFLSSGHRVVLQALLESFSWLPAGRQILLASSKDVILNLLGASFELGVRSMAPVAASLATGLLALAAINRVIPQIGYFALGMSVQTTVLMGSLVMCIGSLVWMLEGSLVETPDSVRAAWQGLVGAGGTP